MRNRWLQIAHTSGAGLASAAASAASLAISARALGADGRGELAAASTWALLFASFGSLSLGSTALHLGAGRKRQEWLPEVAGSLLLLLAAFSCACFAVAGLCWFAGGRSLFGNASGKSLLLAFAALPFLMATEQGRYLLYALDEIGRANRAQIAGLVAGLVALFVLLVPLHLGVAGALVAALIGAVVTAYAGWARLVKPLAVSRATVLELLVSGAQLHANTIGSFLFHQAGILVVNRYRSADEVAFYQLAVQLFLLALFLPSAINASSFAQVGAQGANAAWPAQRKLLWQSLLVSLLLGGLGYLLAPLAVRIVAGPRFLPAAGLFRKLVPALIPATAANVLASQWLGRGLFWQIAAVSCGAGLTSVALAALLVPRIGADGAAYATLSGYGVVTLVSIAFYFWIEARTAKEAA